MEKINKEIAINTLIECCCYDCPAGDYRKACDDSCDLRAVLDYINMHLKDDALWIAKPYEVKGNQLVKYACSECHWHNDKRMPYCPCCGSHMLNIANDSKLKGTEYDMIIVDSFDETAKQRLKDAIEHFYNQRGDNT